MTISPHIMQAVSRERTADLMREAEAYRAASKAKQAPETSQSATRPQTSPSAPQGLIPAGADER